MPMKPLISQGLCYQNEQLLILNQQKLPQEVEWLACQSPRDMYDMIKTLKIRGAPLIGVAAALALAQFAEQADDDNEILLAGEFLKTARPTAVNLMHAIDRQLNAFKRSNNRVEIIELAEEIFAEDAILCQKIANHGLALIHAEDNVLTHCNTGGLVTTGIGTALGIIINAHRQDKKIHVYVDETRPLLQGARLTTWELTKANIPYTLICDNMAASLMRQGKIKSIFVGADRIAANGDVANKIGTYNLAVLANHHKIPFYVAAPYTSYDKNCQDGDAIIIEQRAPIEVLGYYQANEWLTWTPNPCPADNPAFDVTPAGLITAYIFDSGVTTDLKAKQCVGTN